MSGVPWTIVAVEPRGGTVVRIRFKGGELADFDFSYLIGKSGVFAELTPELIPAAQLVDGTVAWETPSGTVDLAADALYDHAHGICPGGSCEGWEPSMTRWVRE
ncbi:DUF2442 domain-containing protein [Mycobacteroides abscessus]|uniref:DUF2442 domain-containing protein n=1 Tax=Mycobacteroides abscessus TaxID=36809 RepID=UPI0009A5BAEF|nr:DUF2442 domain-containing protein [Mycobacteroides abscessus]MBE5513708.1 hypothetical protein [Mycobacteroides abscessus]SLC90942.1 Protein of uncharacterised function (DUF2442) [Mycobacteroides abscessus subsp. massiliense]SLE31343.1 Protein of uncharacterised function (DUF2442) [Mycobacteroides abscessus subsp. massiliense]SLE58658.1 Protein of uncharacterised function (DUF2442) [Mycobacteroides abscessus subsp. massiliense]